MSDPYKYTTNQEINILRQAQARKSQESTVTSQKPLQPVEEVFQLVDPFGHLPNRPPEEDERAFRSFCDWHEDSETITQKVKELKVSGSHLTTHAEWLLQEIKMWGFRFGYAPVSGAKTKESYQLLIYEPDKKVWVPLYEDPVKWSLVFRAYADMEGILPVDYRSAVKTIASEMCLNGMKVDLDKPVNGVCFENGVFDLETGSLRDYRPEDNRMFRGQTVFKDGGGEPALANELLGYLSGGDPSKLKLIRAACYLNICGIHSLPAFKSAFVIWACEQGDGGRSSLFNLVRKASGGDAEVGMSHLSGLADPNTLLRLRGRNYVFIEECQDTVSGRSQAIANLKKLTGGTSRIEVWEKFADKFEIEGHWLVNQAFNGLELMYAADKALLKRSVPIVTESIPEDVRDAYADDIEKQKQMASDEEASKFLRSLWEEFGTPINAAKVINEVKKEFEEDLNSLVQTSDPVSDFCEQWIIADPGALTPMESVLSDFNRWLWVLYPTHKAKNIRTFNTDLKRLGYRIERVNEGGVKIQCLLGAKVMPGVRGSLPWV